MLLWAVSICVKTLGVLRSRGGDSKGGDESSCRAATSGFTNHQGEVGERTLCTWVQEASRSFLRSLT